MKITVKDDSIDEFDEDDFTEADLDYSNAQRVYKHDMQYVIYRFYTMLKKAYKNDEKVNDMYCEKSKIYIITEYTELEVFEHLMGKVAVESSEIFYDEHYTYADIKDVLSIIPIEK